jgi:hypothetical protein
MASNLSDGFMDGSPSAKSLALHLDTSITSAKMSRGGSVSGRRQTKNDLFH